MKHLSREELIALRRQYAHYRGLPLHEVALRRLETMEFVLGRAPSDDELAQAINAAGGVVVLGVTYVSIAAACVANDIHPMTVYSRATRGNITPAQALEDILRDGMMLPGKPAIEVVVSGVKYPSFSAACRAHNIKEVTVSSRAKAKGISYGQAIEEIIRDGLQNGIEVVVSGTLYPTIEAACRAHAVTDSLVRRRAKRSGLTLAEVLEEIVAKGVNKRKCRMVVVVGGITYPSRETACRAHNVDATTVRTRAKTNGITFEEALEEILCGGVHRPDTVVIAGVAYASLSAACKANKVHIMTPYSRARRKGITPAQALEDILRDGKMLPGSPAIEVVVDGVSYPSVSAASRTHNIHHATVRYRAKSRGITYGQALEQLIAERQLQAAE